MTQAKTKRVPANRRWTKKQLKDARWALDFLAAQHYSTLGGLADQVGQGIPVLEKMYRRAEREYHKKITVHPKPVAKTRFTAEDKRSTLLIVGWKRTMPTKGSNKGRELWTAPRWRQRGFAMHMTLSAAYRTHLNTRDKSKPAKPTAGKLKKKTTKRPRPCCEQCGTKKDVEFSPCPYASDLDGDYTAVHLCVPCRNERVRDL